MTLRVDTTMDIGNDELAKAAGVRSIKYYPDKNTEPSERNSNNDVPRFPAGRCDAYESGSHSGGGCSYSSKRRITGCGRIGE